MKKISKEEKYKHKLEYQLKWQRANKDKVKKYYIKARNQRLEYTKIYNESNKEKCMMWLSSENLLYCRRCGYNRCFSALDFHHVDPNIKENKVSNFWQHIITEKRIAEIKKTIPLCANCHREFHSEEGWHV